MPIPLTSLKVHQDNVFREVICDPEGGSLGEMTPGFPQCEYSGTDIARRAVACWNACIGIPTEMLETPANDNKPSLANALAQQVVQLQAELKLAQEAVEK